jgi:hypothetical protein
MSVECHSVVAYGIPLRADDIEFLETKFGYSYEEYLEDGNENYPFYLIYLTRYEEVKEGNIFLGVEECYSDFYFALLKPLENSKEIEEEISRLLQREVHCNHYLFTCVS